MPPRQDVLSCVGLSLPEVFYRLVPQVDHGERDLAEKAFKEYFAGQRADQPDPCFYAGILPLCGSFTRIRGLFWGWQREIRAVA